MVEPEHFEKLRAHYSERHIVEMLAVISLAGWYNRWNNSIATVTDRESVEWPKKISRRWVGNWANTREHPMSSARSTLDPRTRTDWY